MSEIPKQIQSLLKKSGKSYYQIAKESGLTESTLNRIKTEGWGTQIETAQKVLTTLGKKLTIVDEK